MKNSKVKQAVSARKRELKDAIARELNLRETGRALKNNFNDNGRARIDVDLTDAELYAPMSRGRLRRLNDEIFEHIEYTANLLPSLVPLRVVFYGVEPDSQEQARVRELYVRHYRVAMQDKLRDRRRNTGKMIYMILVGVVFLAIYLILALNSEDNIFLEILSIIGSFSLWEAANCFLLERRDIQRELMAVAQFLTAEIVFEGEEQ